MPFRPFPHITRRLDIVLPALCAISLFGIFSNEIYDSDFWWHLRTGKYIVEERVLPVPDPFSWTTAQARDTYAGESRTRYFNLTHEWLAQVAFYAVWRAAGPGGIVVARALTMTAYCALVGLIAWRRRNSLFAALAASLAAASIARLFAFDRPYHVTYLFLAATLAILEFRRRLWLLPLLFMVWANCHGGYFLGWIVLGAWCAESVVARRRDSTLWIVSGLSVLASGLNPNGFQAFVVLLNYRDSFMQRSLLEWKRTELWPPSAFSVLLAAGLGTLLWAQFRTKSRARVADWLIFLAFAAAALFSYRNIILIGIVAPIVIAAYMPLKLRLPAATPYALAILFVAGLAFGQFQFRAAEWKFPGGAADFLAQHHVTQPIFNTYEYGGYLMWRGQKTFIDGRALSESVFQDYARILYNHDASDGLPDADALLARYGIQVIVMNTFEPSTAPVYVLAPALADPAQTAWKLVYNDPQALIFMRTPPPGVQPLNSLDVLTHMEDECTLHLAHEPQLARCARSLGQVFAKIGDFQRARKWIGIYLEHPHAPDAEAENAYRQMLR